MATQIFATTDPHRNAQQAHMAWCTDQTLTVLADGAGRYAVGHLGEIEEDLDRFMAPEAWEWLEVEQEFYDKEA
jgi:hypothetical protein